MNSTSLDINVSETLANKTLIVTTILVRPCSSAAAEGRVLGRERRSLRPGCDLFLPILLWLELSWQLTEHWNERDCILAGENSLQMQAPANHPIQTMNYTFHSTIPEAGHRNNKQYFHLSRRRQAGVIILRLHPFSFIPTNLSTHSSPALHCIGFPPPPPFYFVFTSRVCKAAGLNLGKRCVLTRD